VRSAVSWHGQDVTEQVSLSGLIEDFSSDAISKIRNELKQGRQLSPTVVQVFGSIAKSSGLEIDLLVVVRRSVGDQSAK
jgi:hypothetical protein